MIFVPGRSGLPYNVGQSLGGERSEKDRLKTSRRRRYFSERERLFVQWLFYPLWPMPFTTRMNLLALIAEGLLLPIVNRNMALLTDTYLKLRRDACSMLKTVRHEGCNIVAGDLILVVSRYIYRHPTENSPSFVVRGATNLILASRSVNATAGFRIRAL